MTQTRISGPEAAAIWGRLAKEEREVHGELRQQEIAERLHEQWRDQILKVIADHQTGVSFTDLSSEVRLPLRSVLETYVALEREKLASVVTRDGSDLVVPGEQLDIPVPIEVPESAHQA